MIQQSLTRGVVDFIYKHLKAKYTGLDGILTRVIDKEKIEVLFKSSTNLNDKLEDERLMMKAENMSSMLNVIDTIAGSANIPAKVKGEEFIEYWKAQMEKDPHMRNMFEMMTEEEMRMKFGQDGMPGTGDEGMNAQGSEGQEQQLSPEEAEAMQRQAEEEGKKAGRKQAKRQASAEVEAPDTEQEQAVKQLFQ